MRSFKVKSLSLGGLKNKIFKSGDIVTQKQLGSDVDELVKNGFLEEEVDKIVDEQLAAENDSTENEVDQAVEEVEIPDYNQINKAGIIELLVEKGIDHDARKSKRVLYDLLMG